MRLDSEELAALDGLVAAGRFPSRAEAVRAALAAQRRTEQDRLVAAAYERGYRRSPTTQAESDLALIAASLVPDLLDDGGFTAADLGLPTDQALPPTDQDRAAVHSRFADTGEPAARSTG